MNIELIRESGQPVHRAEAELPEVCGERHKVVLLDAEDEFNIMVENGTGDRETIWTLAKDGPFAGIITVPAPVAVFAPNREAAARAWNAALELAHEAVADGEGIPAVTAPDALFEEWWEREVANSPETWDSHHD